MYAAGAQMHVAALRLDAHASLPIAASERQARSQTIARLDRFRSEAVVDAAAEGLHVEIRRRHGRKVEPDRTADRFSFELCAGREREAGGQLAGDAFEPAAGKRTEIDFRVAAHRRYFDFTGAARELNVAVDGFHLDRVRTARRHPHAAAHRARTQIAAGIAAHIAVDRLQLDVPQHAVQFQIPAHQGGRHGALGRHVDHEARRTRIAPGAGRLRSDANGRAISAGLQIDSGHILIGSTGDLDFRPIPPAQLDRPREIHDLDRALRRGGAPLLDGPSSAYERPGNDQDRQCKRSDSEAQTHG